MWFDPDYPPAYGVEYSEPEPPADDDNFDPKDPFDWMQFDIGGEG